MWTRTIVLVSALQACGRQPEEQPLDTAAPECPVEPAREGWWDLGMSDPVLNEVALYYLGQAWMGATDVSEVLETLHRVQPHERGWTEAFQQTTDRLSALAEASEAEGHPLAAAMAWQRAATYQRAALHRHPDPWAPEVATLAQRAVDMHERYLRLSDSPCAAVRIPYDGTTLPGWFCRPLDLEGPAPTLIFHEGKDGWAEDGKFVVDAAMVRGYNVLLFDGPGMGKTIRLQGLPFRHDWEAVITPVVDFLVAMPEVDAHRVGLFGVSLGGYLAPRAAAYEHRISVLIANPGVLDWSAAILAELALIDPGLPDLYRKDRAAFDAAIVQLMEVSDFVRWGMLDAYWHHGVDSPSAFLDEVSRFKIGDAVRDIQARALVLDAEAEGRGQARELYDALTGPKDYLKFTAEEAAQFHVQPGATALLTQRVFEWLEDNL
jgi:dienelactone hydrolase